jgi:hypothetical protein
LTQKDKTKRFKKLWKLKHEKERGKDEPTHLFLANGMVWRAYNKI